MTEEFVRNGIEILRTLKPMIDEVAIGVLAIQKNYPAMVPGDFNVIDDDIAVAFYSVDCVTRDYDCCTVQFPISYLWDPNFREREIAAEAERKRQRQEKIDDLLARAMELFRVRLAVEEKGRLAKEKN